MELLVSYSGLITSVFVACSTNVSTNAGVRKPGYKAMELQNFQSVAPILLVM